MLTPAQASEVRAAALWYRKVAVRYGLFAGILLGITLTCIALWAVGPGRCP